MQQFTDDEEIDLMMESADKNGDGYLDIKGKQTVYHVTHIYQLDFLLMSVIFSRYLPELYTFL